MGTRALVHIKESTKESETLVTLYRQFDGTEWSMADLHVYFGNCKRCGDFMRLLNNLFEGVAA